MTPSSHTDNYPKPVISRPQYSPKVMLWGQKKVYGWSSIYNDLRELFLCQNGNIRGHVTFMMSLPQKSLEKKPQKSSLVYFNTSDQGV